MIEDCPLNSNQTQRNATQRMAAVFPEKAGEKIIGHGKWFSVLENLHQLQMRSKRCRPHSRELTHESKLIHLSAHHDPASLGSEVVFRFVFGWFGCQ